MLFIDTGYHFEETLIYKEYLTKVYGLKTREVRAEAWKHEFTTKDETWTKDQTIAVPLTGGNWRS